MQWAALHKVAWKAVLDIKYHKQTFVSGGLISCLHYTWVKVQGLVA